MRRREFMALLGGAATWSLAARGQQPRGALAGKCTRLPHFLPHLSDSRLAMRSGSRFKASAAMTATGLFTLSNRSLAHPVRILKLAEQRPAPEKRLFSSKIGHDPGQRLRRLRLTDGMSRVPTPVEITKQRLNWLAGVAGFERQNGRARSDATRSS